MFVEGVSPRWGTADSELPGHPCSGAYTLSRRTENHYYFLLSWLNIYKLHGLITRRQHEDFYGVAPLCGNLIRHQNKDPCPPQAYLWGAGPPGPPSPSSLSVPCDAFCLAKGVPACGHTDACATRVRHCLPSHAFLLPDAGNQCPSSG